MGKSLVDSWTLWHFVFGIISRYVLEEIGFSKGYNFFLSNGIHLLIEFIELRERESLQNNIGDIVSFLLGWFIEIKFPIYLRPYIIYIFFVTFLKEILREIFPRSSSFITPDLNFIKTLLLGIIIISLLKWKMF